MCPSPETETCVASPINKKRGRGMYKSKTIDIKTKDGGKIAVIIPDDIDRAVGSGARDIVNYSGLIMRSTVSFRDGNWREIVQKYGEAMWLKVKDKFEVCSGVREHRMQGFVIDTMQRLFRLWKARLYTCYLKDDTNDERLANKPSDVGLEDWRYLITHFGSENFKAAYERNKINRQKQITKHTCGTRSFAEVKETARNPVSGEKETTDKIWELQHTRKNANGECVFLDTQSEEIHGKLHQLVVEQQSDDIQHPMTNDEILSSVLGERSGYVRGKGYGKKPPRKDLIQQADIDASVSSAIESMRQEMLVEREDLNHKLQDEREDMERKLQDERKDMERKLREKREEMERKLQEERDQMSANVQKKIEEERELMKLEVNKMVQEQMAAIMTRMQQGQAIGTRGSIRKKN